MTERLELRSEDRSASLALAFAEAEDLTGSVAADVEVRAGEFAGAVPSVRIGASQDIVDHKRPIRLSQ